MFSVLQYMWSFENKKLICFDSLSELVELELVLILTCVMQVDSLSVNPGPEGLPELMVSQPGCGYAILLCSWTQQDSSGSEEDAPATPGRSNLSPQ